MNKDQFKLGFAKAALEEGYTEEQTYALLKKFAYDDWNDGYQYGGGGSFGQDPFNAQFRGASQMASLVTEHVPKLMKGIHRAGRSQHENITDDLYEAELEKKRALREADETKKNRGVHTGVGAGVGGIGGAFVGGMTGAHIQGHPGGKGALIGAGLGALGGAGLGAGLGWGMSHLHESGTREQASEAGNRAEDYRHVLQRMKKKGSDDRETPLQDTVDGAFIGGLGGIGGGLLTVPNETWKDFHNYKKPEDPNVFRRMGKEMTEGMDEGIDPVMTEHRQHYPQTDTKKPNHEPFRTGAVSPDEIKTRHLFNKYNLAKGNILSKAKWGGGLGLLAGGALGYAMSPKSQTKKADEQGDNFAQIRQMLADQGSNPNYGVDDTDPYAAEYNRKLLELRDQAANQDPNIEAGKAALKGGAKGGLYGFGAGHFAGEAAKHFVNPTYAKTIEHLPGVSRYVGLGLGALAGAVPAAMGEHSKLQAAKSLTHPGEIQELMNQLSQERQMANNQIGTYRNLPLQ